MMMALVISFSFAQSNVTTMVAKPIPTFHDLNTTGDANIPYVNNNVAPYQTYIANSLGGERSISAIPLGTATNLLTALRGTSNCVFATGDPAEDFVGFIHRNDISTMGWSSSQYRYDLSTDGGANWTLNHGVLNPAALTGTGTTNARYPQATYFNPIGNTDIDSAYIVYFGAWHNGGTGNAVWDGPEYGVMRLNGDTMTRTEHSPIINNGNVIIPNALCRGAQGVYWAVDFASDGGYADTTLIIYKGIWNNSTHDVDWAVDTMMTPGFDMNVDTSITGPIYIAFDKTGLTGYIAGSGDLTVGDGMAIYQPYFIKTTDGGQTWAAPVVVDLSVQTEVTNHLGTLVAAGAVPGLVGDIDMVVDDNGNPHMLCNIFQSATTGNGGYYAHSSSNGYVPMNIFDVTYHGSSYQALWVDTLSTFSGVIATGTAAGAVSQYTRPQISLAPDNKFVFFLWHDSDGPNTSFDNIAPNLIVNKLDLTTWVMGTSINFTMGDATWDGKAVMGFAAPVCRFIGNNSYNIPFTVSEVNLGSGSPDDPASFYYFTNVIVGPSGVDNVNPAFNGNLYPNPTQGITNITMNNLNGKSVEISVTNLLGQEVKSFSKVPVTGNRATVNLASLSSGVYFMNVNDGKSSFTQKVNISK